MSDPSDITIQQIRTVIREEVSGSIAPLSKEVGSLRQEVGAVCKEVGSLRQELVPAVTALQEDVTTIKRIQGTQSLMMGEMRADIRSLQNTSRAHAHELHKLGVLFEDLDSRFEAAAEAD